MLIGQKPQPLRPVLTSLKLRNMQLRTARLCLDCEEIHEAKECPACLSEAFAYLVRWIPVEERRTRIRKPPPPANIPPAKTGVNRWVQRGMVGLAVMAASRLLLQAKAPAKGPAKVASKESDVR